MVQTNALPKEAEIKGSLFPLSILQWEGTNLDILAKQLERKLEQSKAFFYRAPLVINIEKTQGALLNFTQLKKLIETYDFVCVGVCNATTEQSTAAMTAGLATLKQPRAKASQPSAEVSSKEASCKDVALEAKSLEAVPSPSLKPAMIIRRNVRSGQQIYAKDCDLIVIGSVGNGAEVIADGNIHIYGHLRGRALAGASGATQSLIICQSMEAELVSIAGNYWLSDQIPQNIWRQNALFKYESEQLSVEQISSVGKIN